MKISIIGTGYVGLVTGTCFAETGINVTCVDIDKQKIDELNRGNIPIYEPGLEQMIIKNKDKGRLVFSTGLKESLGDCEVVFIAVGTPPNEDGSADLNHVLDVAAQVGAQMDNYLVIATKSTVPVGTAKRIKEVVTQQLKKRNKNVEFDVVSNPEFLKEGDAINDFLKPDRIIIGLDSDKAEGIMKKLYKPFLLNNHPILIMDIPSAEMTKYAANGMLAAKISFMNDLANLCDILGADVNMVRKGIGSDSRIGNKFIYPGVGYGGSCFPKDVRALIKTGDDNHYSLEIMKAVDRVNTRQKSVLVEKILSHFKGDIHHKHFGIWGLSFKPHTDDMRDAPSLEIINKLLDGGASITAYDPVAMKEAEKRLGSSIEYVKEPYEALVEADGLILITEWPEFRMPNFKIVGKLLNEKVIFDGRNIYDPAELRDLDFTYYGIGRS
jgi:UDPglucose 6-dehydrogenase